MMGSITGHAGTGNQHRPMGLNGCMWLSDTELWPRQESDLGGLLCGKSVRPHYCCLCDQRPWPSRWSLCLTAFQRGKWTGWWSTSGLIRTQWPCQLFLVALQHKQTVTCNEAQMFVTMWQLSYLFYWHLNDLLNSRGVIWFACTNVEKSHRQTLYFNIAVTWTL